jgi:SHS2 domain-containing protein
MAYEYLEHTADVKFRAKGSTLEEAFKYSVLAMTNVLIEPMKLSTTITKRIEVKSKTKESLLYDTIQELVFLLDTDSFMTAKVESLSIEGEGPFVLKASLLGDDMSKHKTSGDVKNATYNEMLIREGSDGWTIEAVLDI